MKSFKNHCSGCGGQQNKITAPVGIRRVIVCGDSVLKKTKQSNGLQMTFCGVGRENSL